MMPVYQRLLITAGSLLIVGAALAPIARAEAARLRLPAELDPGALTATYTGDDETLLPSPYALPAPGNLLTFDLGVPGASFFRFDSNGSNTAFAAGTRLLDTNGSYGPVTVNFQQGVGEFGIFVQSSGVDFVAFALTAFRGATPLLNFTTDLIDNTAARGATAFLGVRAGGGDLITSFSVTSTSSDATFTNFFILGPVSVKNADTSPVPEPASMILLGTGLAGVGVMVRKRRQTPNGGAPISQIRLSTRVR